MKTNSFALLFICSLLWACGNKPAEEGTKMADTTDAMAAGSETPKDSMTDFKFYMYIANIPSPFESINELAKADFEYKKDLVNKTDNEKKYITSTKKALNYGVYGVDLAYMAIFRQFKDVPQYLVTARNLAAGLDAAQSFDKIVGARIQSNLENRDTIVRVMDQAYAETDTYLKSSEREMAAILMLTGAWVESQNILMTMLKSRDRTGKEQYLYDKVYENRLHVNSLSDLLNRFPKETELKALSTKMSALNEDFKLVRTDKDLTKEKVSDLAGKISDIRALIIQ